MEENMWTHVFMFHVLKQPQLSVCSLGMDDRLKWSRELLHSYLQTRLHIICRTGEYGQTSTLKYQEEYNSRHHKPTNIQPLNTCSD